MLRPEILVRHRPGPGLVVGLAGLLLALLSFIALPWVSGGGQDATLFDIRDQFEGVDPPSEVAYGVAYARWVWIVVLVAGAIAVLLSTALVPSSKGARIAIGCAVFAFLGIFSPVVAVPTNVWDDRGVVGPRVNGGFLSLCAIAAQIGAHVDLFTGDGAPDPALGVWAGYLGLLVVFVGCLIGTRTEQVASTGPWS